MLRASTTVPLFRRLISAGLVTVILGLGFLSLTSSGVAGKFLVKPAEGVIAGVCDLLEFDDHECVDLNPGIDITAGAAYCYGAADDLSVTESALADSHLQRGPPAC
jgi:hypothetical protein